MKNNLFILICLFCLSCNGPCSKGNSVNTNEPDHPGIINKSGQTIEERFLPPSRYERIAIEENSFEHYLRTLKLKPLGTPVYYYDGSFKTNYNVYISVIDMDIDKQDLQQCADAVMRLKAEYLYQKKKYPAIHFNFVSDGKPRFYTKYANGDYSYKKFRKYMRYIFAYANTSSLYDELLPVKNIEEMNTGDVFIQKGSPYGHAVIVVDMAINKATGKKVYLLAQSYMPAQETQILINPMDTTISPWYNLDTTTIYTPEWTFKPTDLRKFED